MKLTNIKVKYSHRKSDCKQFFVVTNHQSISFCPFSLKKGLKNACQPLAGTGNCSIYLNAGQNIDLAQVDCVSAKGNRGFEKVQIKKILATDAHNSPNLLNIHMNLQILHKIHLNVHKIHLNVPLVIMLLILKAFSLDVIRRKLMLVTFG